MIRDDQPDAREPNAITRELRRKRVTVVDYPDGRLAIRYRGLDLAYTTALCDISSVTGPMSVNPSES